MLYLSCFVVLVLMTIDAMAFIVWFVRNKALADVSSLDLSGRYRRTVFIVIGGINREPILQIGNLETRYHVLSGRGSVVYINPDGKHRENATHFDEHKIVDLAFETAVTFQAKVPNGNIVFVATSMGVRAAFRTAVRMRNAAIDSKCLVVDGALRLKDLNLFPFRVGIPLISLLPYVPFVHWVLLLRIPKVLAPPIPDEQLGEEVKGNWALKRAVERADERTALTRFSFFVTQAASYREPLPESNRPWGGPNDIAFLRSEHDDVVSRNAVASLEEVVGHDIPVIDVIGSWHASASMQPDRNLGPWNEALDYLGV